MMRLYRVTCRGMHNSHGVAYVVAENADAAYQAQRKFLDSLDVGTWTDRSLGRIELLAEEADYPECGTRLLIASTVPSSPEAGAR